MNKLKTKSFFAIFIILSIFFIFLLVIFNVQQYYTQFKKVEGVLMSNFIKSPKKTLATPDMRFIDINVYSIALDRNNKIIDINSHTKEGKISKEIKDEIKSIIESDEFINYGNLYKDKYSYKYVKNNNIVLIDNTETNKLLSQTVRVSILVLIVAEIIAYLIARRLSLWMSKPVEEAFQKQKDFIADASHELKTPLSVIIASAEALEKNPKETKYLNNITNESERMTKLITSLLDLSKIENKSVFEIVNLSKLVEKIALTFESIIYENNIHLKYDIKENIKLNCNSDEIKQVLSILLDNAIKHSSKKGTITIKLTEEKNNIILSVRNKGDEIKKGDEEKIFERFYRSDKSRNREENRYGLGLAIAKSIVIKHNGTIKAHSKDGYTTFTITLKKK